jgi:hypothetical protein
MAIFFGGCATKLTGSVSTEIDPDYPIDKSMVVVVKAAEHLGANTMTTKFYLDRIASALRSIGFKNAYTQKSLPAGAPPVDQYVSVNIESKTSSYQYTGADYGTVDAGRSKTSCIGTGLYVNCTTSSDKTFGVTGYSQKTGYIRGNYLAMSWFDVKSKKLSMFTFASSSNQQCSEEVNFHFLIDEGTKALSLDRPSKNNFSAEVPREICK